MLWPGTGNSFTGGVATCCGQVPAIALREVLPHADKCSNLFVFRFNLQEQFYTGGVVCFCYGGKYISCDIIHTFLLLFRADSQK